jgi:hypothetical protein
MSQPSKSKKQKRKSPAGRRSPRPNSRNSLSDEVPSSLSTSPRSSSPNESITSSQFHNLSQPDTRNRLAIPVSKVQANSSQSIAKQSSINQSIKFY